MPIKNRSIVSKAQIPQAAGNNAALKQVLTNLANAAGAQATKTNTSSKNPPNASSAKVTYTSPYYVVTFTDPGGAAALSLAQAAAQAANSPLGANSVQSVIYHQVQAATSVLFDAPSSLTTFGGDTGSLQTQFVCTGLDTTRQWYFRIRTSFDGQSWNQWLIINNGGAVVASAYAPALFPITGGQFLGLTLPGQQVVGFGFGVLGNGQQLATADTVLLENTLGIFAPAGVNDIGLQAIGIDACSANALGVVTMTYRAADGTAWTGVANFLTFGWAVGNQAIAEQVLADGSHWVTMQISGGCRIALGTGVCAPGVTFDIPAGFLLANTLAVSSPAGVYPPDGHDAHGIQQCDVTNGLPTLLYGDGTPRHNWGGPSNWFALAFDDALNDCVVTVNGSRWIILPTPSGKIAIGQGKTASGGVLPLPPGGYSFASCLAFAQIDGYGDVGNYMHGVGVCTVDVGLSTSAGVCTAQYTNGTAFYWTGSCNWFAVAWL